MHARNAKNESSSEEKKMNSETSIVEDYCFPAILLKENNQLNTYKSKPLQQQNRS